MGVGVVQGAQAAQVADIAKDDINFCGCPTILIFRQSGEDPIAILLENTPMLHSLARYIFPWDGSVVLLILKSLLEQSPQLFSFLIHFLTQTRRQHQHPLLWQSAFN